MRFVSISLLPFGSCPSPDQPPKQYDPHESLANMFSESHRKPSVAADVPPSAAGGINNMSAWLASIPLLLASSNLASSRL